MMLTPPTTGHRRCVAMLHFCMHVAVERYTTILRCKHPAEDSVSTLYICLLVSIIGPLDGSHFPVHAPIKKEKPLESACSYFGNESYDARTQTGKCEKKGTGSRYQIQEIRECNTPKTEKRSAQPPCPHSKEILSLPLVYMQLCMKFQHVHARF